MRRNVSGRVLNPKCRDPCPLERVALVETSKIQILGVPLGSAEFAYQYVEGELLPTAQKVMAKLAGFEDSQIAMYLLRLSYSIVRANHFMRTTPLFQWLNHAKKFDDLVRTTTESILGTPMTDEAYEQACVSSCRGGLGIRRVEQHAPLAFNASWFSCSAQCKEEWIKPLPDMPDRAPNQSTASAELDKTTMDRLIENANERDKQRLKRLDCEHANSWITAQPSTLDGKDTILPPKIFLTAICRLLGLSVYPDNISCPLCMQTMDVLGDHAICCKKTGDTITRHNRVRNLIYKLAEVGMLHPVLEKAGILGHTAQSNRRPADVAIPNWSGGKHLAIDVAVISPLAASHITQEKPCESYASQRKHAYYDEGFKGTNYDFVAMVFETSGAVNLEGLNTLKQLIRFASKRGAQN